jgi:hypothetical protein
MRKKTIIKRNFSNFHLWVMVSILTMSLFPFTLDSAYAEDQCNMQEADVVVCNPHNALSYWQDDCIEPWFQIKYQKSNDRMQTWGPIEYLDTSGSHLDYAADTVFDGFFRGREDWKVVIAGPFIGTHKETGHPLVVIYTTEDCGHSWEVHEIEVPVPAGLEFRRNLSCPELEAKVQPGYFILTATFVFGEEDDSIDGEYGYGCVISTSDFRNWRVSLTGNGTMPPVCE